MLRLVAKFQISGVFVNVLFTSINIAQLIYTIFFFFNHKRLTKLICSSFIGTHYIYFNYFFLSSINESRISFSKFLLILNLVP